MRSPVFVTLLMLAQYLTPTIHGAVLDENLVLRLRFDGDTKVEPASFFTGERNLLGIAYSDDAIDGTSLDLTSGHGGYVSVFNPPGIEGNFTISLWMKLPEGVPDILRGVFSWGPEGGVDGEAHGFFVSTINQFLTIQNFGSTRNSSRSSSAEGIDLTQWNHIAYVYQPPATPGRASSHYLYVNGNNVITRTTGLPRIVYQGNSILIGVNPVGGFEIFPGLIDDFRLYDKPLSQQDVKSLIDEFIPKLSVERIAQGSILHISNPKSQALEVLATSDFLSWDSVHVTGTSKLVEYFFDNLHQGDLSRFYMLRQ